MFWLKSVDDHTGKTEAANLSIFLYSRSIANICSGGGFSENSRAKKSEKKNYLLTMHLVVRPTAQPTRATIWVCST